MTTRSRQRDTIVENPEFAAFAARILRAAARRVGDGDVEGLAALVALRSELDAAITVAVQGLRSPKRSYSYSWADIARVLGTTRQAAQQRYGAQVQPPSGELVQQEESGPEAAALRRDLPPTRNTRP